jgi:hypothetical protein
LFWFAGIAFLDGYLFLDFFFSLIFLYGMSPLLLRSCSSFFLLDLSLSLSLSLSHVASVPAECWIVHQHIAWLLGLAFGMGMGMAWVWGTYSTHDGNDFHDGIVFFSSIFFCGSTEYPLPFFVTGFRFDVGLNVHFSLTWIGFSLDIFFFA